MVALLFNNRRGTTGGSKFKLLSSLTQNKHSKATIKQICGFIASELLKKAN